MNSVFSHAIYRRTVFLLLALNMMCGMAMPRTITVAPSEPSDNIRIALAGAQAGDVFVLTSGTFIETAPLQISNLSNVTIRNATGANVVIRSTNDTAANKLIEVLNCVNLTFGGMESDNRLTLQGQGNLAIFANEDSRNANIMVENIHFSGEAGAVGAVSTVGDTIFRNCIWTNSGNGSLALGNKNVLFENCRFELATQSISIHNILSPPGSVTLRGCYIRGNDGSGGSSSTGAMALNSDHASKLVAENCTFSNFLWTISGQFVTGTNKEIVLVDPVFEPVQWGIASISSGFELSVRASDPKNKVDLRDFSEISLVRILQGQVSFTDCIMGRSAIGESVKVEPYQSIEHNLRVDLERCFFPAGTSFTHNNPEGGIGGVTLSATNCIFEFSQSGALNLTNETKDTIRLHHCTLYPSPQGYQLDYLRTSANDLLSANHTLFDAQGQNSIATQLTLTGSNNLVYPDEEGLFSGPFPEDTLIAEPLLDPSGHLSAISPAIDAAQSALGNDFDGDSRPVGESNDIGADELGGGTAIPRTPIQVTLSVPGGETEVGMGRSVRLAALARYESGQAAARALILPYVNGKRWGAHAFAGPSGKAEFHLPLPHAGPAEILLEAKPPEEQWIWARRALDNQTVYLQGSFEVFDEIQTADLWIAADDVAEVFINGSKVGDFAGISVASSVDVSSFVQPGENLLSIKASNLSGTAGIILRLEYETESGFRTFLSHQHWQYFENEPVGWPNDSQESGKKVILLGTADHPAWNLSTNRYWPALPARASLFAGYPMPATGSFSNSVQLEVTPRQLQPIEVDPDHLVGAQYGTLYSPLNPAFQWYTAQAVPLVGFFWSKNPDVARQHMIWMIESGVSFLVIDRVGAAFFLEHWSERGDDVEALIQSTNNLLDTLATMRDEGHSVPKVVILAGLCNGPCATITALNEELTWIHQNYNSNPRYQDLFVDYLGKPLLLVFSGNSQVDDTYFTLRNYTAQHQANNHHLQGYWTWMNGTIEPLVTRYQGQAEALTACIGLFDGGGWTGAGAYGRQGGWTLVETFKGVLQYRPRFTQLHQFNEFAGQYEGAPYAGGMYGDSYNIELSDDYEPVSLNTPGYRENKGGWGFFYLNLVRALVDLYRQPQPETTVIVVSQPTLFDEIQEDTLTVKWTTTGAPADSYTVSLNGKILVQGVTSQQATIDLSGFVNGPKTLRVTAEGTQARYLLDYEEDSLPLEQTVPACCELEFDLNIPGNEATAVMHLY